jgi:hypothetical protein
VTRQETTKVKEPAEKDLAVMENWFWGVNFTSALLLFLPADVPNSSSII